MPPDRLHQPSGTPELSTVLGGAALIVLLCLRWGLGEH